MERAIVRVEKLTLPTYAEPAVQELPMFAENRVHQRTSGNPYPNKVVMEVDREHREDKEYTVVRLENEFIEVLVLPEIGGRIYAAKDKTTGYDFFYKQHVIKPALIGALGSWVSGGVEFNWPFHHRASGYMPCDFVVEELEDGTAICHLSEHDPTDRMKGMVSIVLRPGEARFETRMRLYNRTALRHSFLWWENAAVPVNEQYQIFFPQDVSYVNFHYLKSHATYPVAGNCVYNGITMKEARDISMHKNTTAATSYFCSASDFDFFGGYDHGKQCGVVHIGDRHVTPGKKMFTWGYGQLSRSWEKALTDTDGQYAELMAGSYSDNQPNFTWLEPYETKEFSQHWYPIAKIGVPIFANLNGALALEGNVLKVQTTCAYKNANVRVMAEGKTVFETVCDLEPAVCHAFDVGTMPFPARICVTAGGKNVLDYTHKKFDAYVMPDPITDTPAACTLHNAQDLYLAGVHLDQYRDPAVKADVYFRKALQMDEEHVPSLIALARYEYARFDFETALSLIERAVKKLSMFNARFESGEAFYVQGQILEAMGEDKKAYDAYRKAAWAQDCASKAMTRAAMLCMKKGDFDKALQDAETALGYLAKNSLAACVKALALKELGDAEGMAAVLTAVLAADPLDRMAAFLLGREDFYPSLHSSAAQTCMDIACDLLDMGCTALAKEILQGVCEHCPAERAAILYYMLAHLGDETALAQAEKASIGRTFPFRQYERKALESAGTSRAKLLLGCLLYDKRHYAAAAALWEENDDYMAKRNLAVGYFSHLGKFEEALRLMQNVLEERPEDEEVLYETVTLMDKLRLDPAEKIKLITAHRYTRDDLFVELAKAYNQTMQPEKALEVLAGHVFVSCEGGEHAIADQYIIAYLILGLNELKNGNADAALNFFVKGQTLPDSLGAGIWNHCKLIPLRYQEARCLELLGSKAAADEIYTYIADTEVEYFSNMHLKELPFYQVLSLRRLGQAVRAQQVTIKYRREWDKIPTVTDSGFFGTTPFFIPFIDEPARLRKAQHRYLSALMLAAMGEDTAAAERMKESAALNNDNMFAVVYDTLCIPE
ncbi:MAG: DUF5107 domain-containing protein [Clostridia bacterium]|nr:DUF5107 domain-containing protein [Clostridia bacterium]